jgi:hypothetical protein
MPVGLGRLFNPAALPIDYGIPLAGSVHPSRNKTTCADDAKLK